MVAPPPPPVAVDTPVPAATPVAADTPVPTVIPAATDTPVPTTAPAIAPTVIILPQQWNGIYVQSGYGNVKISLVIEAVKGDTFSGKMIWQSIKNGRGAITKMNGMFVKDFGDTTEQSKWGFNPDFKNGDKSGTWLKWTETDMIQGSNYTLNGWYYAHIRTDGTMVGIYFFSASASKPASDSYTLTLAP